MIVLDHVSKSYGDKTVFRDLSLTIPDKGVIRISGPSGSGKTTLFRLITGLEEADNGRITGTEKLRFSCVFQEPRLIPSLTAAENVSLIGERDAKTKEEREAAKKKASEMLTALGLSEELEQPASELSGGQKMRTALARALTDDGDILILDEAFSGIDEERKKTIFPLILKKAETIPVLLATHDDRDAAALGAETIEL